MIVKFHFQTGNARHFVWLRCKRYCSIKSNQVAWMLTLERPLLPPAFVEETLSTLALLLPEYEHDVQTWFESVQKNRRKLGKTPLDALARENKQLKAEERQIENFVYWHDRLVILKQVYDEAEPQNMRQWWHDRRKRVQWYTFWVAAMVLSLTVFFGLVQSIEGALQVYITFRYAPH